MRRQSTFFVYEGIVEEREGGGEVVGQGTHGGDVGLEPWESEEAIFDTAGSFEDFYCNEGVYGSVFTA